MSKTKVTESRKKVIEKITLPLYSFAEADHLANTSRGTSKRWLSGYCYRLGDRSVHRPPITRANRAEEAVSFRDLIEIVAIGRLKGIGFSLTEIRLIVGNCQELLRIKRPLTSLKFKTDGHEIFVERGSELLEVGRRRGMQAWKDVLKPFLADLDYAHDLARRWWPLGKEKPIVVDPDYGFGLPVIGNSGVRTEIVLERFQAGDLDKQIAADFNLSGVDVQRALQFELSRAA